MITRYPTAARRRALFHGAVLAGLLVLGYVFLIAAPEKGSFGYDAYAYWTVDLRQPYGSPDDYGALGFFTYSPVVAIVLQPLTVLPWPAFVAAWWGLLLGALSYLGRRSVLVLLAFPPVAIELYHGNVHLLLAAAMVLGFRHPWAWSAVLLTKITPGIGLLWFAVRREWWPLLVAVGATAGLAATSALLFPHLWRDWLSLLLANAGSETGFPAIAIPLWLRLPVAAALVVWGARGDRRWTVPLAATIALPVLWIAGLSMLVACWPLLARQADRLPGYDAADAVTASAAGRLAPARLDRPARL